MLHAIQYSLIEHLKALPFTAVVWAYSGVSLAKKVLPFATVEHRNTPVQVLDKLAEYVASEYNFQVGVMCSNAGELAKLQEQAKRHILKSIPLYNTDGTNATLTAETIRAEVTQIVPLPVEGAEGLTSMHRAYLDVRVYVINQL